MMRSMRWLYILHLLLLALAIAHTDKLYGQGQGYAVRRILPTQAVSSSQCGELVGTAGQPICITQRYDASLRPVQRVAEGAGGTGEDLATLQEYDAAGRLTYRWSDTPFSASNTNGFPTFHTSADFASMSEDGGTTCISYTYEPSPLSRLTSTKGVHSANTSITTEVSYRVPTAVRRYSYLAPYTFRQAGLYTTPLRMERIVDEEGGYMERYTDSRGLMLLQRQGKTGEASTLSAADLAANQGVRVYTISIGSTTNELNQSVHDAVHEQVAMKEAADSIATSQQDVLQQIAARTGGKYFKASTASDLSAAYSDIDKMEKHKLIVQQDGARYEAYAPFALAALALLALSIVLKLTWLRRWP